MPAFARAATRLTCIAAFAACSLNAWADVTVTDAWVRGTVAGQDSTGAYMKVRSTTDAALVAISSPRVPSVELHAMQMDNGVMRMRAIDRLALPAGKTVELGPSGYHVMLTGLQGPLNAGDKVPLTLTV